MIVNCSYFFKNSFVDHLRNNFCWQFPESSGRWFSKIDTILVKILILVMFLTTSSVIDERQLKCRKSCQLKDSFSVFAQYTRLSLWSATLISTFTCSYKNRQILTVGGLYQSFTNIVLVLFIGCWRKNANVYHRICVADYNDTLINSLENTLFKVGLNFHEKFQISLKFL